MIKRISALFVLTLSLLFSACSDKSNPSRPEVAFFAEESGLQTSIHMLFDLNNSNRLCEKPVEIINLDIPSQSIEPLTGFIREEFIVIPDSQNTIVYGNYFFADIISDDVERTTAVFKQKGSGEKAIGSINGNIFSLDSAENITKIGECQLQDIETAEGEKRSIFVSRLLGQNSKWLFAQGDKIFVTEKDGALKQVGWIAWRKLITPEGKQLAILMTKGMDEESKWAGRYDGKLYQDK